MTDIAEHAARIAAGHKAAVASALNLIENRRPDAQARIEALLAALAPRAGVHRIGLTGPPGVGKSSLTSVIARELRARGQTVGVLAVDPSSRRSGGALLGDRARMELDPSDTGHFVRSLATGGDTGGLAYAANAIVTVFSAAYDRVLVETVGVGQSETDIEYVVDTVCLVIQPGSGDTLQFVKAGIMEIPDVLVVNKGDEKQLARRAAGHVAEALADLRRAGMTGENARVPILITSARDRIGIEALIDACEAHRIALGPAGLAARRHAGAVSWTLSLLQRRFGEHLFEVLGDRESVADRVRAALAAQHTPPRIVADLGRLYLDAIRQLPPAPDVR